MNIDPKVRKVIEEFPTNTKRILSKKSYFWVIYSYLRESSSFLEIGYRKGLFAEICRAMSVRSIHVDISNKLLRAHSSENNKCITMDSMKYLKESEDAFDLIFQDGSKIYRDRVKEYNLIMSNSILKDYGTIIIDDLHYGDCEKAFNYAIKKYKFDSKTVKVKDKRSYSVGILQAYGY